MSRVVVNMAGADVDISNWWWDSNRRLWVDLSRPDGPVPANAVSVSGEKYANITPHKQEDK